MKKLLYFLLLFIFIPITTHAEDINFCDIVANSNVNVGDTVKVDFAFDFKDAVNMNSEYGIYMVAFELDFDNNVFDIVDVLDKSNWNQTVFESDGKYYAVATYGNANSDSISTYRGKYIMRLSFFVKDTKEKQSTIKIKEYGAMLFDKNVRYFSDLKDNDIKQIEEVGSVSHTFTINEGTVLNKNITSIIEKSKTDFQSEIKKETSTIYNKINNNASNTKEETKEETKEDNENKAYNNYLKTLEIEGYKIDFNKHQAIYSIEVDQNINSLKINAVAESNKSTVKINGSDNLEQANNKVTIEVTSGNKETKTYIINVKKIEKSNDKEEIGFKITDDQIKMAIIFGGIVLGVALIIFIIVKIKDRKVEKIIDKW